VNPQPMKCPRCECEKAVDFPDMVACQDCHRIHYIKVRPPRREDGGGSLRSGAVKGVPA
jgi:hypothetical protein